MINKIGVEKIFCEYLIIGSGAGGSVACKYLVDKGKDVLLIEEGDHYKVNQFNKSISKSFLYAWRNSGMTPVISKSNFGFGEGKCLGGGTYINGGLIWRTPEIILDRWNNEFNTDIFSMDNMTQYFEDIESTIDLSSLKNNVEDNSESKKILEIGKKNNIKVVKVPRSINSSEKDNELILGAAGKTTNSILQKFIYPSKTKGLRLMTKCRAQKLISENNQIKYVEVIKDNLIKHIHSKEIILACGATQTPMIIKRSFGNSFFKSEINVHLNLRLGARFNENMQINSSLMFSQQIQEYLHDGVLIMPTSFNKNNFFSSLAKLTNKELMQIEQNIQNYSSFIIQLASSSNILLNNFRDNTILSYNLNNNDIAKLRKYFVIFCNALFNVGAEEIYLPFKKNYKINKDTNLKIFFEKYLLNNNLEMVSVHGMSSAKMGQKKEKNIIFDINGKSFDFKNLFCLDSSVLPTCTIESPQATIMAVALKILNDNFN